VRSVSSAPYSGTPAARESARAASPTSRLRSTSLRSRTAPAVSSSDCASVLLPAPGKPCVASSRASARRVIASASAA
jgi:hypothetical protein